MNKGLESKEDTLNRFVEGMKAYRDSIKQIEEESHAAFIKGVKVMAEVMEELDKWLKVYISI